MKVNGKVIVVTGGGNGIGRELVLLLLTKGARVAAVDINPAALQETVGLAGSRSGQLSTHVADITNREAVAALPAQVIEFHGAVDGLINNAGIIQPFRRVKDLDYAAIQRVLNVNLFGTIYMTKEFLPCLLERPDAHLVNISSMGGFLPVPGQTIYGAAKAGVKLFTEGLYSELLNTNVRVTVVFPGAIGTNIAANSGVTLASPAQTQEQSSRIKPLPPAKAAQMIVEGMEQNRYRVLVGSDARFLDLIYRLSPQWAANYIFKQMQNLLPD
ncbi:short-chain dehydrogenase of various substrate specificities [Bellilinea caldifistulae]|uniref:Short-chain dehydrogenase n=1 Tax=Bellilinea caldifistulae TaxID=360411 RepID=A0A0P6X2I7_9CHLR|nr:SDR family oxidoreductase [Bellilinea caldifistulae]KPL76836.1 short-chain dehydrogenase [Bellilinea caldifistulae]GAP08944.1 short-chain dehydrogenase of various substrate specificities [Bellilinea caldifistulae]